jgi:hypothetical protein
MPHLPQEVARRRVATQALTGGVFTGAPAVVQWLGAVQAQDYPLARWSVAQRFAAGTPADVEAAIATGTILRTHVLRPTWHFVPRDDLRWMQELTAPRVLALMKHADRRDGIDADLVLKSSKAIAKAIARRGHLTRKEVAAVLARAGIEPNAWRVGQLLAHAELRAIVCSGVPRGGQQTYALVEERAPRPIHLKGDDAAAELALRYFRSHGPATLKDFRWWSGVGSATAAHAVEALGRRVERFRVGDRTYITMPGAPARTLRRAVAHLIQPFDEIVVAYSESRDVVDASGLARKSAGGLLLRGILLDGQLAGLWTASPTRAVRVTPFRILSARERAAVERARARFESIYFA